MGHEDGGSWIRDAVVSAVACIASSLDEVVILVALFAKAATGDRSIQPRHVFTGRLVATSVVMALSAAGGCIGWIAPPKYLALMGLVPLLMGLAVLSRVLRAFYHHLSRSKSSTQIAPAPPPILQETNQPTPSYGAIEVVNVYQCDVEVSDDDSEWSSEGSEIAMNTGLAGYCQAVLHPGVVFVALVLLADESEEVAIFASLFSSFSALRMAKSIAIVCILDGIQCVTAYYLASCMHVFAALTAYIDLVLAVLLIALGSALLRDSTLQNVF